MRPQGVEVADSQGFRCSAAGRRGWIPVTLLPRAQEPSSRPWSAGGPVVLSDL